MPLITTFLLRTSEVDLHTLIVICHSWQLQYLAKKMDTLITLLREASNNCQLSFQTIQHQELRSYTRTIELGCC